MVLSYRWRLSYCCPVVLVTVTALVETVQAEVALESCPNAPDGSGTCPPSAPSRAKAFWAEMRKRGLQLKIRRRTVEEKAQAGRAARNRTAMVLTDDVFYGRAIMKIPRPVLLSAETAALKPELRKELAKLLFEEKIMEKRFNATTEDSTHMLSLAYPLISENRDPDSVFREWLDVVRDARLPVLQLTERQRRILNGTTVDHAYDEMRSSKDFIAHSATNFTFFKQKPVTLEEAEWALAVIMRHARVVHPHQDVRETFNPRMYLVPLVELLSVELHQDPAIGISFQEEIVSEAKREEELVLQIARRDMAKGEEIFFWPGRFSNSDMIVRYGMAFDFNRIGIGKNVSQPPNWDPNVESNIRKEYDRYNCSSLEAFELRLSTRGLPMRQWVRCFRVSWFLSNGWYTPAMRSRIRELDKWPPPPKYTKEDWLSWTQCDAELNRILSGYCTDAKKKLKDTIDSATASDFRKSSDPMDRLLWHLRGEESRTFKECIAVAKKIEKDAR